MGEPHDWKREWSDDDGCNHYVCRRCGLETEEVILGVPNTRGARELEECDMAAARSVMEE